MCGGGGLLGCTCPIQTLSNPPLALVHGQLLRTDFWRLLLVEQFRFCHIDSPQYAGLAVIVMVNDLYQAMASEI